MGEVFAQQTYYGPRGNPDNVCYIWDPEDNPDEAPDAEGDRWSTHSGDTDIYTMYYEEYDGKNGDDVNWTSTGRLKGKGKGKSKGKRPRKGYAQLQRQVRKEVKEGVGQGGRYGDSRKC